MGMIKFYKIVYGVFAFSIITFCGFTDGVAQEAKNVSGIEEIIVTARQQAESLQDVPVTVSVMSELDLD
jgi:outer membrane cobalamin receptor